MTGASARDATPPGRSGVPLRAARLVTAASRAAFGVAKWGVWAIAALMLWEVASRYAAAAPTSWAPELATLIFGPYFLLGGPYLLHLGGHVAVDIVSDRATGRTARVLEVVAAILALIFGAILLWFAAPLAWQSWSYGETSYSGWRPLLWPSKAMLPLAAALLMAQALAEIVLAAHRARDAA